MASMVGFHVEFSQSMYVSNRPVLNVYVVHLSDRAFSIRALILGTCIKRE